MATSYLVFDGECGFCRKWVRHMTSWFSKHPTPVAYQSADLFALGLTADQCKEAVQYVSERGEISSGSDAAARVLIHAGFPYLIAGWVMLVPGIRNIAQYAYKWVANNRYRFSGDPL
jgi:predicted DCC family thiol-disulfide oxidoreductase YuxK